MPWEEVEEEQKRRRGQSSGSLWRPAAGGALQGCASHTLSKAYATLGVTCLRRSAVNNNVEAGEAVQMAVAEEGRPEGSAAVYLDTAET